MANTLLTLALFLCPAADPRAQIVGRWEWQDVGPSARVFQTFHAEGTYHLSIVRGGEEYASDEARWNIEGNTLTTWIVQGHLKLSTVYGVRFDPDGALVLTEKDGNKRTRRLVRVKP